MDKKKDPMEQIIIEDLINEAKEIDAEIARADMPPMPEDAKERIRAKLNAQIEAYDKERLYEKLSTEDKKAFELGKRMLEKEESAQVVVYRKKKRRMFIALAAVLMLVLAMGVSSMGGTQRVVEMMKNIVGTREVVQVDTDEDNYIVEIDKEEEAYQEMKDVFGVDPVKPIHWPEGTVFVSSKIDEKLLMAELIYEYNDEVVCYYVSTHFTDSSWGLDIEDTITDNYFVNTDIGEVEIKEFETPETKTKRYMANYNYNSLEYFLIGTMEKADFDILIKNLNFF